jgi:dehydrogenase/reductase SDR family member 7B
LNRSKLLILAFQIWSMEYKNKIVWITGASSGIGKVLSLDFAKLGAILILSSYEKEELLQVQEECLKITNNVHVQIFDLSIPEEVANAANSVLKEFGRVDVLINNGGLSQRSFVTETPIEMDRKLMEINYFAGVTLTKAVLSSMIENGYGHITVTSSISGKFGFPLRAAYAASKHAIHGFYETVRAELKDKNIRVTIVCPGRVRTDISKHALTKDGKPTGEMDAGLAAGISPESTSRQIISAMKKNKMEVLIGGKELLMVHIKRFFPRIFFRIVTKVNPK